MAQSHPIVIIGAGISGLAFAQGCLKLGLDFRLYERDSSLGLRSQGYRVRVSDEGIHALEQLLPDHRFQMLRRSCSLGVGSSNVPHAVLNARTAEPGEPLFKQGQQTPNFVHTQSKPLSADRGVLRKVLMEGIEESVYFGKQFQSYYNGEESIVVRFTDGTQIHGSILVGSDGSWSKVRQQLLPSYRLLDTEGRLIYGKTDITETLIDQMSAKAMQGLTLIREAGLGCLLEPMSFDRELPHLPFNYVYWVLFLRSDSKLSSEDLSVLSTNEAADLSKELTGHWHKSFVKLFDYANQGQTSILRIVSAHPDIPTWNHDSRVTLMGDAIHAMSPTAALGATTALQDAALLARLLALNKPENFFRDLREYEASMRIYARMALQKSVIGGKMMFDMRPYDELCEVQVQH